MRGWSSRTAIATAVVLIACCSDEPQNPSALDGGILDAGDGASACDRVQYGAADLDNYDALLGCLRSAPSDADKEAALTTFLSAAEAREGFPLVAEERVVFVYVRRSEYDREDDASAEEDFDPSRRLEPIRVAGDFNDWQGADTELQHEWGDFFHRSFKMIVSADDRWRYKLVARDEGGEDVWFSDPLSRRFDYDENGRISLVRGGNARGHFERIREVPSASPGMGRDVYVYVPGGYDFGSQRYPVLYMHDGNNLFDLAQPDCAFGTWDVDGVVELESAAGRIRAPLVVGIPNDANRMGEYSHVEEQIDGQAVGGDGDAYARFVAEELKPLVDLRYRTLPGRESTAILGSSLGGLISFYVGYAYPETFKYVGGMSSTFGWGSGMGNPTIIDLYGALEDLEVRGQVFYLDSGGGAPGGGCSMAAYYEGSDNYCDTLRMKARLESKGIDTYPDDPNAERLTPEGIDIFHWHEPGAAHDEAAWSARLHRPLRLFFRP